MQFSATTFKDWKSRLHVVIFESNTRAGKMFDVVLLFLIMLSILVVLVDSIDEYHNRFGNIFYSIEWAFTVLFTIEYILRLLSIKKPIRYATSFLGIIDLLAIIPSYLSVFVAGAQSLLVLRALRLLRVFRIFKLTALGRPLRCVGDREILDGEPQPGDGHAGLSFRSPGEICRGCAPTVDSSLQSK